MGLKTCEIVFDTAVCVFKTGEWIHGRVIVEPDEDSKVKGQIHTKPLQIYCDKLVLSPTRIDECSLDSPLFDRFQYTAS